MGLGVERIPRTACPPPSVPPVRATTPMPPHIQGAERRQERPAPRTGYRWGLRALAIAGLAGAAWLLTGAAAHAADRNDEPTGSLLGAVVDGDATTPVTGLLHAAVQPLEAVRPAHRHHDVVSAVADLPRRVLTRPVGTVAVIVRDGTGIEVDGATRDVGRIPAEITEPDRLTGGSASPQLEQVEPVRVTTPAEAPAAPEAPDAAPAAVVIHRSVHRPARIAAVKVSTRTRHGGTHQQQTGRPAQHRPAATAALPDEAARTVTPGGDGPAAPLRLHLGDASGTTSTSGSGSRQEGGSAAVLPAAIAYSTMACQTLPIVSDVEVRRHDAGAPTVSPD